ncbi:hypothetical protein FRC03_006880 [Tulasnella sp. 419]|nr:hypothetical protein FRC03_006880 [Tulasnella sp. 419]
MDDDAHTLLENLGLSGIPSRDQLHHQIEEDILLPKTELPPHWLPRYQSHWEHKISIPSLLKLSPSPPSTQLTFQRAGLDGRITGYVETPAPRQTATALTSTSISRAPGPASTFVRGKSGYIPFLPGGLDDVAVKSDNLTDVVDRRGLRKRAPGLSRGIRLGEDAEEDEDEPAELVGSQDSVEEVGHESPSIPDPQEILVDGTEEETEIDHLLPAETLHVTAAPKPKLRKANVVKRDWAHVVDVGKDMPNFHELVPDMARKYPFELDTFQKQAVYHLEMGDSVFVAAHTSAGKTVVAEYAIALAAKHMTRAIYTSPIKALSNQKFRDFKITFDPSTVGILTGDVQINPEGSCLIMTTEILRSMLYKGADIIRDVEFVIFDEVHYVNDAERGVVWEEVIIMLPDHVNIILLSATVPNTREFAEWVGRTKKRDVYVISTPKRPVPLEHYLYAGRDMHKIVSSTGEFLGQGFKEAGEALRRKQDKEREAAGLPPVQKLGAKAATQARGGGQRGAPTGRGGGGASRGARGGGHGSSGPRTHMQQDKNLWVHLVGHLKKKALLPVVVFTFSKKKCEEHASTLTNTDLSTSAERSEIHVTIEKALTRLKGSDKNLPQIRRMRDLLSRGIAVHHGGLLPIVKEVVELLFARGLVKVLFATETFAMGVNMPARCVVFSHIRKHDGRSFRDLLPGEYTQMSGRAGRRGLDATGVVIIVSGDELPDMGTIRNTILGPSTKLQSQFRLTYNMILNLLRVEALRVEEMIKRSFSENASQRLLPDQQKQIVKAEKVLQNLPKLQCDICERDIEAFYDVSAEIVYRNRKLLEMASNHPQGGRLLGAGRVVILRDAHFQNRAAILLKLAPLEITATGARERRRLYHVLACVSKEEKQNRPPDRPVTPRWPPSPESLLVDAVDYEYTKIYLESVALVTDQVLKVCPRCDLLLVISFTH